jgi:hypothetical protein
MFSVRFLRMFSERLRSFLLLAGARQVARRL